MNQATEQDSKPDPTPVRKKPRIAVWKFASCDGCQLSLLDCEDELLTLTDHIEFAYFPEATKTILPAPYDLSLVEGSISTPEDKERILKIRAQSKFLITIGACATAGGIQSLRNFANIKDYINTVYASPQYINTLSTVSPIAEHVHVDLELRGCPINKEQLLEFLNAFLNHRTPNLSVDSVCTECKASGNPCIMVTQKKPCLGPVTHAGCNALCPSYNRACFGCFGPRATLNTQALAQEFIKQGCSDEEVVRLFRSYNAASDAFKTQSLQHDTQTSDTQSV